jgi:hypothetical protein
VALPVRLETRAERRDLGDRVAGLGQSRTLPGGQSGGSCSTARPGRELEII